jgi:hypothetical protein
MRHPLFFLRLWGLKEVKWLSVGRSSLREQKVRMIGWRLAPGDTLGDTFLPKTRFRDPRLQMTAT